MVRCNKHTVINNYCKCFSDAEGENKRPDIAGGLQRRWASGSSASDRWQRHSRPLDLSSRRFHSVLKPPAEQKMDPNAPTSHRSSCHMGENDHTACVTCKQANIMLFSQLLFSLLMHWHFESRTKKVQLRLCSVLVHQMCCGTFSWRHN